MDETTATTPATTPEATTSEIHIPTMQGEPIHGLTVGGVGVTTTILSTWIFMGVLLVILVLFRVALTSRSMPRIRGIGISLVGWLETTIDGFLEDARFTRRIFPLIAGSFIFILLANFFSLLLDWTVVVSTDEQAAHYLRPINSDLNTTLAMAIVVIILSQIISLANK